MKACSSSYQCQMRPDEKAEHNCSDLGSDSVQLLLCSKILHILEITSSSRDCLRAPLLLFKTKSSLPGAETSFIYMFSSSSFSVSASVAVSHTNLFHRALTHKTPKARSLMAASLKHLVNWPAGATVASILTLGCCPQLCATTTVFCCLQDTFKLSG